MSEIEIKQKLDRLAEYQMERNSILLEKKSLLESLYTPEIKARIAEIEEEFSGKVESVGEKINHLENEIKQLVIAHGTSVKGSVLQAVLSKGRASWDTKSLKEYAKVIGHPEILSFYKEGEPSVSIRVLK